MVRIRAVVIAAGLFAAVPAVRAQGNQAPAGPAVYKAEFVIHDRNNPGASTDRRYTLLVDDGSNGVFRSGNKIPYATSASQYQYAEIGVNIDCRVREVNGKIALNAALEMSAVAPREKATESVPANPTISSTRFEVSTTVHAGKPVLVASMDDPLTTRKLEIEAIISRVN